MSTNQNINVRLLLLIGHGDLVPRYKHGLPNAEIDLKDLKNALKKFSSLELKYKAYIILLFWLGLRRSEPLFIKKEHIEKGEDALFISITCNPEIPFSRLKQGRAAGPMELPLNLFGVNLIQDHLQQTKENSFLFDFCDKTGYRKVKVLFPKKSPHWLRHNRLTKLRKKLDQKLITKDEIKAFTGIRRDSTIEGYGMKTKPGIHKVAQVLE